MSFAPTTGLCLDCNYSLRDLPTPRCPECGREFDPADKTTFNPGRPVPTYAAWAVGPISLPVYFVAIAGCATTIWRARLPGMSFSWTSPAMVGWAALAILWIAWPLVRRLVLRHHGWPPAVIRPMGRRHWIVPLVMLAMVVMTSRMLPRRLAFAASRGAMDQLAAEVMANPQSKFDNRWVGLFQAKNVRAIPGGMKFTAEDDDIQFKAGFVYLPKVDPKNVAWKAYRYIGNGWWSWREEG
ncbi:MAG TPA: hypothetical protein VLI90_05970 [Tepidisphaeraceae bacterium]|nr:hypothetical protein [Tepidisphaeraceae bacterium]